MNKAKYFLCNADEVIGIVYEDEKYGRTLMITDKLDSHFPLIIRDNLGTVVADVDLMNFILSMLPQTEVPNEISMQAIREADEGIGTTTVNSVDELMKAMED